MVSSQRLNPAASSDANAEPASYYHASANASPHYPPLPSSIDCDVCVIGAGITGCAAALNLAERGYRVVVLEAATIGHGGSGRSGGQMIHGYARGMNEVRRLVPRGDDRLLWDLSVEALKLTRERIQKHQIRCDFTPGYMAVAIKARQRLELLEEKREFEKEYGYPDLRMMETDELRSLIDSPRYLAGLFDPHSGHLHPLNYTLGLADAAGAAGAMFFERSPAVDLALADRCRVTTPAGSVDCRYLILSGGAYLGELVPSLRRVIMPVGTYITATEPLGETRARTLVHNAMAVCDTNFVLDYFRLSADHRLLFGGRVSYSTVQPPGLATMLYQRMLQVFPQLAGVRQDYTWGGFVDITMNRFPHFGRLRPNVYFAHGFSGHGIALTGLAGKLLAETVAGTAERFDLFAKVKHRDFPGGKLMRMPLLVLAMAWFRLRDLL